MLWALIFLRYGLLPTILLHALFDLALIVDSAVPHRRAGRAACSAALVIAAGARAAGHRASRGALQRGRVARARRRRCATARGSRPRRARRRGAHVADRGPVRSPAAIASLQRALPLLGVAGLAAWIAFTPLRADVPPLPHRPRPRRSRPRMRARRARRRRCAPEWRRLAAPSSRSDDPAAGAVARVRLARGGRRRLPRARRQHARAAGVGSPLRAIRRRRRRARGGMARHDRRRRAACARSRTCCPEARPGAKLRARTRWRWRERRCASACGSIRPRWCCVAAEERQRPARADWTFTFADPRRRRRQGRARRACRSAIAGDEVASVGRSCSCPRHGSAPSASATAG